MYLPEADAPTHTIHQTRLLALASRVEASSHDLFDMQTWLFPGDCGTVACIGGTAQIMMADEGQGIPRGGSKADWLVYQGRVRDWMGLSGEQFQELCFPRWMIWSDTDPRRHDTAHAATVIRHLVATGEVVW